MVDWLIQADITLFFLLNKTLANPVFDVVMPILTNIKYFRVPYLLIWIGLIVFGGKRGRVAAVLIILTITFSDQMSSSVIKPLVGRIRPCNALEGVRLLVGCSRAYSFTSSHATNIFAAATFFTHFYPKARWYFFIFAGMVAYSRSYVGVHYPGDLIFGALLGILCAWFVIMVYHRIIGRLFPRIGLRTTD
jgi:undecaprenyl-diphosphatase